MALTAQNMVMLRKVHCVIGGFCISFAAGQFLLLGNFGTYVESYMTERVNFRPKSKWFISAVIGCNLAAASVMMFVGGFLERRLGTSWATFIGFVNLIGARVLSYWVVQQSVAGTIILFGIFPGFGFGLLYGLPFSAMHKHTFHNLGLMYGLASSGYGVGAFVFNLLITGFTNPWNEKPDAVSKSGRHFSQPHILDRVPVTFLILAGIYTAFLPIAVTGVRDPPHSDELKILIKDPVKRRESRLVGNPGLPPRDLFKSKTFYVAWLSAFLIGMVYFLATGMYKELGMIRISNDIYMAALGATGSLCSGFSRPVWGFTVDKIGLKRAVMVWGSVMCIMCAFWTFILRAGSFLYFLWTSAIFFGGSAFTVLVPLSAKIYFGVAHFVTNLACIWTAQALAAILLPFVSSASIRAFGWDGFGLFLALCAFVGLLNAFLLPDEDECVPHPGR